MVKHPKSDVETHYTPALIYPYLDHLQIRYDYPVVLLSNGEHPVHPLRMVFDALIDSIDLEGDPAEKLKRYLLRLEVEIKKKIDAVGTGNLDAIWDVAADALLNSLETKAADELRAQLSPLQANLPDGVVVGCTPEAPSAILAHLWNQHWQTKTQPFTAELEALINRLENMLWADDVKREDARDPDHLKASMGSDDVDFEALSSLLADAPQAQVLPDDRRLRVEQTLDTIKTVAPTFTGLSAEELTIDSCVTAVATYHQKMERMVGFFKAIEIGELEADNQYKPDKHDSVFAAYGESDLTPEEWALCPPLLVDLTTDDLTADNQAELFSLMMSGLPIKVLVRVTDSRSTLASQVMMQHSAVVLQSTAANLDHLLSGFETGLAGDFPALFAVYVGDSTTTHLSTYLSAAAALESRLVPAFTSDFRAGSWADQFDISPTPQAELEWSVDQFEYQQAETETEISQTLEFTPADFLAASLQFDDLFELLPREKWDEEQFLQLADYLRLSPKLREGLSPYIFVIDDGGVLHRAQLKSTTLKLTEHYAKNWHRLQELGGFNNSHVQAAIDTERERLEAEKQAEIEALEAKYEDELNQNVGELTQVIVDRIASGLLSDGTSRASYTARPAEPSPKPKPKPKSDSEETPELAPEPEPEEEDDLSFDDPYIDTPLCTSCNECTNLNNQMFAYDENKQAYIKDVTAGTYRELVVAAEKCPVHIIHPGKPKDPDEPNLDDLQERAAKFN